ncbi:MAG: formate/nitrite transporter family protein [Lachnospiraceae bacterium]|nr:formate/nitrite transporter family protein [Lachnospiraceae bacterium]
MYAPSEIAKKYTEAGADKTRLSLSKTFILAVLAGIYIAFGAFGSQVVAVSIEEASLGKFLSALVFPVGLLMVIMAGAELFTGNSLIIISVLNKKATLKGLLRNWGIVYLGNLVGSMFIAAMLTYSHTYSMFDGKLVDTVVATANNKISLSFSDAFLRGILCNILVCIAVWISFSAEDVAGKILGLFLPIMLFVISGYEHCVANMYFIPAGILVSSEYQITAGVHSWADFLIKNLLPVTLGNIVGGVCIVGMSYFFVYLHDSKSAGRHEKAPADYS